MTDLGMNARARDLANRAVERATELRVAVHTLAGGGCVVDAGIEVPGGYAAGRLLAELCMGGLGHVGFASLVIGGESWSGVHVWTDHPAECCMTSQYAGWAINPEGFFAMGSGPLLKAGWRRMFAKLGYAEQADSGVLVLEGTCRQMTSPRGWLARRASRPVRSRSRSLRPRASPAVSDRRAGARDGAAQDGHDRLRREAGRERHGHRAVAAPGEK
jgi:methenyltetrahydromethanopterin cyclohydrolase